MSGVTLKEQGMDVAGSVAGSTGILQADNVLYAGMDETKMMQHKALTMSNTETFNLFHAEPSPEMRYKVDRDECRMSALLIWRGCMTGLVVLALAGVVVSLSIIFSGFLDVCAKSCPTQGELSCK